MLKATPVAKAALMLPAAKTAALRPVLPHKRGVSEFGIETVGAGKGIATAALATSFARDAVATPSDYNMAF